MSKLWERVSKAAGELVVEAIATVIGWVFCLVILSGAFALGHWAASYSGDLTQSSDMVGLLSAFALVWLYEHRNIEWKYERLRELIEDTKHPRE
jgi:hypothetical protein